MGWFESAADLPAPRDDEPAHLRQDIQDELADHLQAALERELRHGSDETTARERVLEQFGDPRRVARKLWWDAMREKVMSQRVQIAASVLMLVTCAGMFWMTSVIAGQGRAMNEAMLVRLDELTKRPLETKNPVEWNPAVVQLVTESGAPLPKGYAVTVQSEPNDYRFNLEADAEGRADFGFLRPGNFTLSVRAPWGQSMTDRDLWIRAGSPFSVTVVCPTEPPTTETTLELQWPEDLKASGLWLGLWLEAAPRKIAGHEWFWDGNIPPTFLVDPTGKVRVIHESERASFAQLSNSILDRRTRGPAAPLQDFEFSGPIKTTPVLSLPSTFRDIKARVFPVRMRDADEMTPIASNLARYLEVPLEFHSEAPAHWTLKIPEGIDMLDDEQVRSTVGSVTLKWEAKKEE
jgi:hypothetical protein